MSKFTFFMWCVWITFLLSIGLTIAIPLMIIIAPIALIALVAYIIY